MKSFATLSRKIVKPLLRKKGAALAELSLHWSQLAPEWVGSAQPEGLNQQTLVIAVGSSSVGQRITLAAPQLMNQINTFLGYPAVNKITVKNRGKISGGVVAKPPQLKTETANLSESLQQLEAVLLEKQKNKG